MLFTLETCHSSKVLHFPGIDTVVLDEDLKVFTTQVTVGNSVELKCDIQGTADLAWKRNGASLDDITTNDIKVSWWSCMHFPANLEVSKTLSIPVEHLINTVSCDVVPLWLQVFEDGSLYLNNLGLHHMANYTCQDRNNDRIVQTHVLKVQSE